MSRIVLCAVDAVSEGEAIAVGVGGHRYAVAKVDGQLHVIDDRCPHAGGSLGDEGSVDGHTIECGWHEARFDLRSGVALSGPCKSPVHVHAATVIDGQVCIER